MNRYEYRCKRCGTTVRSDVRADTNGWCLEHSPAEPMRRVWGFSLTPIMHEHYNPSTNTVVSSRRQHLDHLKQAEEAANAPRTIYDSTGQPYPVTPPEHHFVPVDLRDKAACGVTNEGLDSTYDALRREGRDDQARRLKALMDD